MDARGVPQSYVKALQWFRKAAEQGDAAAQALLGFITWGRHPMACQKTTTKRLTGTRRQPSKEIQMRNCALENVVSRAVASRRVNVEALRWFRKAADQGLADA